MTWKHTPPPPVTLSLKGLRDHNDTGGEATTRPRRILKVKWEETEPRNICLSSLINLDCFHF